MLVNVTVFELGNGHTGGLLRKGEIFKGNLNQKE
jgi:hypothetical protein